MHSCFFLSVLGAITEYLHYCIPEAASFEERGASIQMQISGWVSVISSSVLQATLRKINNYFQESLPLKNRYKNSLYFSYTLEATWTIYGLSFQCSHKF